MGERDVSDYAGRRVNRRQVDDGYHLTTGYPPEPWTLRGQLYFTAWRVPSARLPRLSTGLKPVQIGGTSLVGTAWVIYEPGGVLSYRELLVAVLAHRRGRPVVTITDIWVDSGPSLHGGRELWGIPKQRGSFHVDGTSCAATDGQGQLIARATVRPIGALPGRLHLGCTLAQRRAGELLLVPVRCAARMRLIRISWEFTAEGPLGWLAQARPSCSTSLHDFRLRFGRS